MGETERGSELLIICLPPPLLCTVAQTMDALHTDGRLFLGGS